MAYPAVGKPGSGDDVTRTLNKPLPFSFNWWAGNDQQVSPVLLFDVSQKSFARGANDQGIHLTSVITCASLWVWDNPPLIKMMNEDIRQRSPLFQICLCLERGTRWEYFFVTKVWTGQTGDTQNSSGWVEVIVDRRTSSKKVRANQLKTNVFYTSIRSLPERPYNGTPLTSLYGPLVLPRQLLCHQAVTDGK